MILKATHEYPQSHAFVLKLREGSRAHDGAISGRLEHLASTRHCEFHSIEELLQALDRYLHPHIVAERT